MAKVDELVIELRAKTDQFERGMDAAGKTTERFGAISKRALLASAAAAGAALGAFAKKALAVADELATLEARTGVSAQTFSALQFSIEDAGGSLGDFSASLSIMQDNIGQLANGTESAINNFGRLGISFDDLRGQSPEKQFFLIADSIGRLGTEYERTEAARNIFGRGAASLIPVINQANGSLSQFVDTQVELGKTLSSEQVELLDSLGNSISAMSLTIRNRAIGAFADLLNYMGLFETKAQQIENLTDRIAKVTIGLGRTDLGAGTRAGLEKELETLKKQADALKSPAQNGSAPQTGGIVEKTSRGASKAKSDVQQLQEALDDLQRAANRDLATSGLDETQKAAMEAKFEISDLARRFNTELTPAQQEQAESIIDSRVQFEKFNEEQRAAKEAADASAKAAEELGYAFESAFEDAVLNGGKLSDVLGGLERDLAKIFLRETLMKPIGGAFKDLVGGSGIGSFFGDLFSFRAGGGAVQAGMPYVVGEKRPEIFVPQSSGRIVPSTSGMGGGGNVNVTIINSNGSNVRQSSTKTSNGVDLRIMIEEAVAQGVARTGSPINTSIKGMLNTSLVRR